MDNEEETSKKLVSIIFARRLYREWYLFLDDLAVATGRPSSLPLGPSGADDVIGTLRGATYGERAVAGFTRASGSGGARHCPWRRSRGRPAPGAVGVGVRGSG